MSVLFNRSHIQLCARSAMLDGSSPVVVKWLFVNVSTLFRPGVLRVDVVLVVGIRVEGGIGVLV